MTTNFKIPQAAVDAAIAEQEAYWDDPRNVPHQHESNVEVVRSMLAKALPHILVDPVAFKVLWDEWNDAGLALTNIKPATERVRECTPLYAVALEEDSG